ncbi:NUDIX hydrolase [Patescibacteria group bacterium]
MIPENAKSIFKGIDFEVFQWPQKMYDGSIQTFESVVRPDTVDILAVTKDQKFLYQKQTQPHRSEPFYCLPGGRIDEGEEPLAAAKRELLEETGFAGEDWELFMEVTPSSRIGYTNFTYIVRGVEKIQEQELDPGEKIWIEKLTFDELLEEADKEEFRHSLIRPLLVRAKYNPESRKKLEQKFF